MRKGAPVTNYAIDPFDPGNIDTRKGFFASLQRMHDVSQQFVLPCIVRNFDSKKNTVSAEPLVSWIAQKGSGQEEAKRPIYEDVPVMGICRGGFEISFPIFIGDTGLLVSLDRNCDTAIAKNSAKLKDDQKDEDGENKGQVAPDDFSLSGFEHAVFIPFSFAEIQSEAGQITIKSVVDETIVAKIGNDGISSSCGDFKVSVSKDGARISGKDDSIILTKDGPIFEGKIDETFEVVCKSRYDASSHQLQNKVRTMSKRGTFIVRVGQESKWTIIEGGQAEPIPIPE